MRNPLLQVQSWDYSVLIQVVDERTDFASTWFSWGWNRLVSLSEPKLVESNFLIGLSFGKTNIIQALLTENNTI